MKPFHEEFLFVILVWMLFHFCAMCFVWVMASALAYQLKEKMFVQLDESYIPVTGRKKYTNFND